jgi:hypothetical protein
MSESSSINTLIGTFSSIGTINERTIDTSNLICIDTSNNRIGINTIDPSYSITILDKNNSTNNGIYTPRLYFDLSKTPTTDAAPTIRGQVYCDSSGYLRVKL